MELLGQSIIAFFASVGIACLVRWTAAWLFCTGEKDAQQKQE